MLGSSLKRGSSLRDKTSILQGQKSQDPHSLQEGSVWSQVAGWASDLRSIASSRGWFCLEVSSGFEWERGLGCNLAMTLMYTVDGLCFSLYKYVWKSLKQHVMLTKSLTRARHFLRLLNRAPSFMTSLSLVDLPVWSLLCFHSRFLLYHITLPKGWDMCP